MKKYIVLSGVMSFLPSIAFAQDAFSLLAVVQSLMDIAVPLIIGAAVIFFLYGLMKYIMSVGEDKETGKQIMIWGIIALFVMVSVWGLVNVLSNTTGIGGAAAPTTIPTLIP
ncbi:hypothetical protein A2442_01215 [Candidatus Campbellbacteria bacterium RIFOXYC2_FULL_35_25]|uniref:DUF4134 domain-containing protein n=1 Tax=Candidatus Campbellbacteria bacterium RIFOXYC2_FULL_35_25 TaxID=1797582 RepID=A0A1F5EH68_9BACT|nr:MAG: hypothetical protein A2442_01215 [Candidatus Campbellbacteria bacterium RIFOXYC2_FULL_35_25]